MSSWLMMMSSDFYVRLGPSFAESTALLNNMRIYLVLGWMKRVRDYLVENPDQKRYDEFRCLTAQLMTTYKQTDVGQLVHEQVSVVNLCSY